MLGIKTSTASLLFAAATLSFAAQPEYLPLQTGNSWAYKSTSRVVGGGAQTIDVQGVEQFRNQDYFRVGFMGRTVYLRATDAGISVFNSTAGSEARFLPFDSAEGQSVPVEIGQCTGAAKIESKAAKVTTPVGEWDNAIHFTFSQSCADAGLTQMYLVPNVGIVSYETSSIAGPVRYDLVYIRSGATTAEAPQTSFTVALNAPTYTVAPTVDLFARLTIRSTQPVKLTFPSSQRFDLRVWNDRGEIVYTWSADKLFGQVFSEEQVGPGERTFAFVANVPGLPVGRYVAEMWLATSLREFVGTVGFLVVP